MPCWLSKEEESLLKFFAENIIFMGGFELNDENNFEYGKYLTIHTKDVSIQADKCSYFLRGMKKMKRILIVFTACLLLALCIGVFCCSCASAPSVVLQEDCWNLDVDDPRALAGFSNYVFVGVVEELEGSRAGELYHVDTFYRVRVLENIKGTLDTAQSVQVRRQGGYSVEENLLVLCGKDDFLPLPGDVCVFFAMTCRDGTLALEGPFDHPVVAAKKENLQEWTLEEIQEIPLYQELVAACADPIPYPDKHEDKRCRYDVDVTEEELFAFGGEEFVPSEDHSEKILSILSNLDAYRGNKKDKKEEDESDKTEDIGIVQSTS